MEQRIYCPVSKMIGLPMAKRERMSGADNAWRRLGTADNLTTITGVLTFEDEITYEELCDQLDRRLVRFDRFRQFLGGRKRNIRRPYWERIEDFDLETHVYRLDLPEPKDKATLQRFVGTLSSRPLDERRPLWEAYLFEEYEGGSAVVVRLNHCLGDGFALMWVLFGLADKPEEIEFPIGGLSTPDRPEEELAAEAEEADATALNGGAAVEDGSSVGGTSGPEPPEPGSTDSIAVETEEDESATPESGTSVDSSEDSELSDSEGGGGSIFDGLKLAGTAAKTALELLLMSDEPQTSLHDDIGPSKRAAWTKEMDIGEIKAIGEVHDATINNVMLAATAGVFHRTLESRGEDTTDLELRCTVPVNLKPMDQRDESLGNYFGLAFVPVPVDDRGLDERIEMIRDRADVKKLGIQAYIMYQVLSLGGWIPEPIFNAILPQFEHSATAVVSNVPGPMSSIELNGHEVKEIMFWNPQAIDQGLSVSIFTYDGTVQVGVSGDANLIPEPEKMTQAFEEEVEMLIEKYVE